jgi:hypothetical protein
LTSKELDGPGHKHTITISCIGCSEPNEIAVWLPTAVKCEHCGMIFDARIMLRERGGEEAKASSGANH